MRRIWDWLKKYWKLIAGVVIGVVAFRRVTMTYLARRGNVRGVAQRFRPDPTDSEKILVETPDGEARVTLPLGVKAGNVKAVGYTRVDGIVVEAYHDAENRRSAPPAPDNPFRGGV